MSALAKSLFHLHETLDIQTDLCECAILVTEV